MAPRIKSSRKGASASKIASFGLSETAKQLILRDHQGIDAARAQLQNTLITLAAGAGVPEGITITNVDLEAGLIHYILPSLKMVEKGSA